MAGKPIDKAEAGKQKPEKERKSNAGSKSKYTDEFPALAEGYARQGLSDVDIAKNLGISLETYYSYQKKHPKFFEAIREGKKPADLIVENALYKRCIGCTVEEEHTEVSQGENGRKIVKKKIIKKQLPPDVNAARYWLSNRQKERWSNNPETAKEIDESLPNLVVVEIGLNDKVVDNTVIDGEKE
jgi:hypothetical protein